MVAAPRIRRQQVRNITAQVKHVVSGQVVGTGVLVSSHGLLVTCAHVVEDCGVDPRCLGAGPLPVRIPETREHDGEDRGATVKWFPTASDDDLVVLALSGGPIPPERVGVCGPAGDSEQQPFRSFGYRRRADYLGLRADGDIKGHVPTTRRFLVEPLQLSSQDLDSGMSGAAVYDVNRNLVVGFVFQTWDSGGSFKDRDLAFAVDAALLANSPVREFLVLGSLEPEAVAEPEVHHALVPAASAAFHQQADPGGWVMEAAPETLGAFAGRADHLRRLDNAWREGRVRVLGLTGLAGQGKTSLVRTWLERFRSEETLHRPDDVFWWTFEPDVGGVDEFLAALIAHLSAGAYDPSVVTLATARANLAARLLKTTNRQVIVLDGLEGLQEDGTAIAGSFASEALGDFLTYVAAANHRSLCILTSPHHFPDLEPLTTFEGVEVDRLSAADGREVLRTNGVGGSDADLDAIVEDWDGHALALTAVAAYLVMELGGQACRFPDLPGATLNVPFALRLHTIGNALEGQRPALERTALAILALTRTPLPRPALDAFLREEEPGLSDKALSALLNHLSESGVRTAQSGAMLLHPVLRSLYRAHLRLADPEWLRARHRGLADYYYAAALTNLYGDEGPS